MSKHTNFRGGNLSPSDLATKEQVESQLSAIFGQEVTLLELILPEEEKDVIRTKKT